MKDVIIALIAGATILGVAGVIAWSTNNTATLYNEKVTACVENGGTWLDYNSLCISATR